jgi:hypothetical protein
MFYDGRLAARLENQKQRLNAKGFMDLLGLERPTRGLGNHQDIFQLQSAGFARFGYPGRFAIHQIFHQRYNLHNFFG